MEDINIDNQEPISDLLTKVIEESEDREDVSFEFLLDTFGTRTFAPILLIPAMLILTPIGAIPGLPSIVGIFILIVSSQLIIGLKHPWVPEKIDKFSVNRKKLLSTLAKLDKIKKPINYFENLLNPRIKFLTSNKIDWIYGILISLLAISMIPLEIIPFAAFLPATGICLISVALLSRDGILAILALSLTSIVWYLVINSF